MRALYTRLGELRVLGEETDRDPLVAVAGCVAQQEGATLLKRSAQVNVIVGTHEAGFLENGWTGHQLQIGDRVRLGVALPDPRCVMTTLAQDELPKDTEVLRTLARQYRLDVAGGLYPCAGVYAIVESAGMIREGDGVSLT